MSKNQKSDLDIEMLAPFEMLDQLDESSKKAFENNVGAGDDEEDDNPDDDDPGKIETEDHNYVFKGKAQQAQSKTKDDDPPSFENELAILATQWKADGRLPADFEITEKLDEESLDKAVYEHKVKALLDDKFQEHITKNGLTDAEIKRLRGQKFNVDPTLYDKANAYQELSKIELKEEDENGEINEDYEKDLKAFLTLYYKDIQYPAKKIEKTISDDIVSDELEELIAEAKKHFASKAKSTKDSIKTAEANALKAESDRKSAAELHQKSLLKAKKIADHEFTDEEAKFIENAIFNKTEIVTLKDGSTIKTSLYDKKIIEATNDPEKAFLAKALFVLQFHNGDTPVEKASKGILSQLRQITNNKNNSKRSNAEIELLN